MVKNQLMGFGGMGALIGSNLASGIAGELLGLKSAAAIAGVAIGAGLTVAAAAGLVKCAALASDLNETIAKTEQVFGSATDVVTRAADEMASKFGIVKTDVHGCRVDVRADHAGGRRRQRQVRRHERQPGQAGSRCESRFITYRSTSRWRRCAPAWSAKPSRCGPSA